MHRGLVYLLQLLVMKLLCSRHYPCINKFVLLFAEIEIDLMQLFKFSLVTFLFKRFHSSKFLVNINNYSHIEKYVAD